jgi:hypothetical protein
MLRFFIVQPLVEASLAKGDRDPRDVRSLHPLAFLPVHAAGESGSAGKTSRSPSRFHERILLRAGVLGPFYRSANTYLDSPWVSPRSEVSIVPCCKHEARACACKALTPFPSTLFHPLQIFASKGSVDFPQDKFLPLYLTYPSTPTIHHDGTIAPMIESSNLIHMKQSQCPMMRKLIL